MCHYMQMALYCVMLAIPTNMYQDTAILDLQKVSMWLNCVTLAGVTVGGDLYLWKSIDKITS